MKIVSSGKVLNTSKLYKKKKRKKFLKFSLLLLLLSSFICSLVYLSRQEKFFVSEVVVSGEDIVDRNQMIEKVSSILDGYYLWFIPKANIVILPRREIKLTLLEAFKRLRNVELNLNEHVLVISLEERVPTALYCSDVLETVASDCYFLDEEAFIFAKAPAFSGPSYFIYGSVENIIDPIGKNLMSIEGLATLSRFLERLENLDIKGRLLEMGGDDYTLLTDKGVRIMWKKEHNLEKTYSNLSAFLSEESIREQKNFLERAAYLDLRVEDKVFYRFER